LVQILLIINYDLEEKMRILIVDDNEFVLDSFSIGLEDCGFELDLVNNPLDAFHLFYQQPYEIVILDIIMPIMNGIELLKHLKFINKNVKIIIISAFENMLSLFYDKNEIIYQSFIKPVDIKAVKITLNKIKDDLNNQLKN
jgi:DNA-binding NtrC family response regulator